MVQPGRSATRPVAGAAAPTSNRSVALEILAIAGRALGSIEEFELSRELLERSLDGRPTRIVPFVLASQAELDLRTGDWPAARRRATEAARLARVGGQAAHVQMALVTLARLDAMSGDDASCRGHLGAARASFTSADDRAMTQAASVVGLLELGLGHPDAAITALEAIWDMDKPSERDASRALWMGDLIEAYVRTDRRSDAVVALSRLRSSIDGSASPGERALMARCRGLIESDPGFESAFEEALSWHDRVPAPFERARTELCYGELLRRARRRQDARRWLRAAQATFLALGSRPWARQAEVELAATTESTRSTVPGVEELTSQELEVARRVATGAQNREVAAALFLSPKTIEFHLGNVFGKLGVRSRTELANRFGAAGSRLLV